MAAAPTPARPKVPQQIPTSLQGIVAPKLTTAAAPALGSTAAPPPAPPAAGQLSAPASTILLSSPNPSPSFAARIAALEKVLEDNPFNASAWEARVTEAAKFEGKSTVEATFEKAVKQLPMAAKLWTLYAEWSEAQADAESTVEIYKRCLDQLLSMDLWTAYLNFSKRYQPLEQILRGYKKAVDCIGTDPRAGVLWVEYMTILKHAYNILQTSGDADAEVSGKLLSEDPSPIEVARKSLQPDVRQKLEIAKVHNLNDEHFLEVMDDLGIDLNFVRQMFQRAVSSSHSSLDKLWANYEQFEKSHGNPQLQAKLLGDYMPRYVRAKTVFKELSPLSQAIDHQAAAVPITAKNAKQQTALADQWRKVLLYERNNPLHLEPEAFEARVSVAYQQAILALAYHAEIWYDFHIFLDQCGHKERATACLQQGVDRFLPLDLTLRLLIAQRLELSAAPPTEGSLKATEECYKKIFEDMRKPCPLAVMNYLAFVRRQHGPHEFREAFLEIASSSEHCTWEVYAFVAFTEYHVFGSQAAASQTFRLGLERYKGTEPSLLAAFVNFLLGINDFRSARAELSRGVLDRMEAGIRDRLANRTDPVARDSLAFLWQKWARLEVYFGDAGALRRVTEFRDTEYRKLQLDQKIEEETIAATPASLGLSTAITEVEESFRFLHLLPQAARVRATKDSGGDAAADRAATGLQDQATDDATHDHRTLTASFKSALPNNVVRPDTSKMLVFKPTLEVDSRRKSAPGKEQPGMSLSSGIPKCLQDLLHMLPSTPLKGTKPDVDYLLATLQHVQIPPVPVKELEQVRYDSLRISKDSDGRMVKKRASKDDPDGDADFFGMKPSAYRERLQVKRQRLQGEQRGSGAGEGGGGGEVLTSTKAEATVPSMPVATKQEVTS